MFQRVIDDLKDSASKTLRLTYLATVVAVALLVTLAFLCAAAFVYLRQEYGTIEACLVGALAFFIVAVISAVIYRIAKNRAKARAAERTKSALQTALADPMLMTVGIQLVRAVGIKRLIPIIAVAGVALGMFANRHPGDKAPQP
ncbi:MAG TPA: hypothetical protein VFH41_09335 [Bradyrhizobium sp.]|nr:hypothetical protein [Bradyrhizobium sp.]